MQVCRHTLQIGIGSFSKVDERDGSNNMAEGAHKHKEHRDDEFFPYEMASK